MMSSDQLLTLKRCGVFALRLFNRENPKAICELDEAVKNAQQLDEYAQALQTLEKNAWDTLPNSREWKSYFFAQRKYLCCLQRHQKNSRKFGWSPLSRRLLCEQYVRRLEHEEHDVKHDPMTALLCEYGVSLNNVPEGTDRQWDAQDWRMEELLNGKW